jgi:hypothetical protein
MPVQFFLIGFLLVGIYAGLIRGAWFADPALA